MPAVPRRTAVLALAVLTLALPAGAAEPLGLERALELAQQRSGKLGGAAAELTQKQEQVLATQGLGGPVVSVAALGYGYEVNRNVSLQPFAGNLNNAHVSVLEDGGKLRDMDRSALSAAQGMAVDSALAMKQRFDPAGLLNPGKLRGWVRPGTVAGDSIT